MLHNTKTAKQTETNLHTSTGAILYEYMYIFIYNIPQGSYSMIQQNHDIDAFDPVASSE